MEKLLAGKTGIVLGVANKRSIAWACAKALSDSGMRLAFTYAGERLEGTVRKLVEDIPGSLVLPCDVTIPEQIDELFEKVEAEFGGLDTLVKATADAVKTVAVYTLVTQICPQQVEATLFSWVMGAQFMGSIVAQVLGGKIPRTCTCPTVDGAC